MHGFLLLRVILYSASFPAVHVQMFAQQGERTPRALKSLLGAALEVVKQVQRECDQQEGVESD